MSFLLPGMQDEDDYLGASIIREHTIILSPRAMQHYGLQTGQKVLLMTSRRGEGSIAIMKTEDIKNKSLEKFLPKIKENNTVYRFRRNLITRTKVSAYGIFLTAEISEAFCLYNGDRLTSVISMNDTLCLIPTDRTREQKSFYRSYSPRIITVESQ